MGGQPGVPTVWTNRGCPQFGPGTPTIGEGSMYKKKAVEDLGLNQHTSSIIHKENSTPPQKGV